MKCDIETLSRNHCCSGKTISVICCQCVSVAIVMQHAMRMRHTVVCGLPRSTIFFPHYLINGTIFEKKLLNTKCVFWFSLQLLYVTFLILRRTERDMIKTVYRSSCKVPCIIARFEYSFIYFDRFSKETIKYKISWKPDRRNNEH